MKFCDKLAKLRKNNNLSQEQLADRLGVSRQAVSKWESGLSHPDMDKIIQMCKILDCKLEDLMDDDIVSGKGLDDSKKNTLSTYFNDFLSFLTKVLNMFSSMRFKEKIKCLFEMFAIGLILCGIGTVLLLILNLVTYNLLSIIPYSIQYRVTNILSTIYLVGIIIFGMIIFIHLFKVRYLDYYVTIEDSFVKEKVIEKPIEKEKIDIEKNHGKEVIIIRDPKHSSFSFISLLGKIIKCLGKVFCGVLLVPVLLFFILIITASIVVFYHVVYGNIFIFLSLICVGLIVISYLMVKLLVGMLFNSKLKLKRMFIVFISSIVLIGVGSGLAIISFTGYKLVNNYDDFEKKTVIEEVEMKEKLAFYAPGRIEYEIDNSLDNVKVEITSIDGVSYRTYFHEDKYYPSYQVYVHDVDYSKLYEFFMNDLENKVIRTYNSDGDLIKVKVYLSEENYKKLGNYYKNY
ncbi:MAG: helix-turn-helix domain-containing protein [Bacilli bacterium]|nr:helix-turn-helix domain-containing protein [Bacilli bacterium]